MGRARRTRPVVAMLALAAAIPVGLGSPASAGDEFAREVLTKARNFASSATSVEYTGDFEIAYADPTGEGSPFIDRGTLDASALFPDRGRTISKFAGLFSETIYIEDEVYARDAETRSGLKERKFGEFDPELYGASTDGSNDFPLFERPQDLSRALDAARRPRTVRHDGDLTLLEVEFPAADVSDPGYELFDAAVGRLVIAADGRVKRLALRVTGPEQLIRLDYRYTRWNGRVSIEPPSESEIDATPFVDDEAIAAYQDAALYQPAEIPEDWVLDYADILTAAESLEGCRQVEVDYTDPTDAYEGFMEMYMFPSECGVDAPRRSEPFVAGPYTGFTFDDPEYGERTVEIDVDGTRVQVVSDLDEAALVQILANLVPLDLANPPPDTLSLRPSA